MAIIEKYNEKGIKIYHGDCMEAMALMPDKAFELAIVDVPYGIGRDGQIKTTGNHGGRKAYPFKEWDKNPPSQEYFTELFRISGHQIIWGANYITRYLPSSMGWIFWDKGQRIAQSDGELAFTSFERALRVYKCNRVALLIEGTIHPTQKPVKLYEWLLTNYAKSGDRILDTHLGSGSIAIACDNLGFELTAYELDEEYVDGAVKRLIEHRKQLKIFDNDIWR